MNNSPTTNIHGLSINGLYEVAKQWVFAEDPVLRIKMACSPYRQTRRVDYMPTARPERRPLLRQMASAAGVAITFSDEEGFQPEQYNSSFRPRYNLGERDCMIVGGGFNVEVYHQMVEIAISSRGQSYLIAPTVPTEYDDLDFPITDAYNQALAKISSKMGVPYHRGVNDENVVHIGPTDRLEEFMAKVFIEAWRLEDEE